MHVYSYKVCNNNIAAVCKIFVKKNDEFMIILKNIGGYLRLYIFYFILKGVHICFCWFIFENNGTFVFYMSKNYTVLPFPN